MSAIWSLDVFSSKPGHPMVGLLYGLEQEMHEFGTLGMFNGHFCVLSMLNSVFGSFGNEPMQSCSVHHVSLLLVSSVLSSSASVYSCPSGSFDPRNFISADICTYVLSLCTWNIRPMYHTFLKWQPI